MKTPPLGVTSGKRRILDPAVLFEGACGLVTAARDRFRSNNHPVVKEVCVVLGSYASAQRKVTVAGCELRVQ